jgi:undecaprenyl pyrophosphate phosphatase UppP
LDLASLSPGYLALIAAVVAVLAVATLFTGMRVRDRLEFATYRRALQVLLWLAVVVLLARGAGGNARSR